NERPETIMSSSSPGLSRQIEIYQVGQAPTQPISVEELEEEARKKLKAAAFAYLAGGAGGEETMRANREAFQRWQLVPRFLRNVAERDLSVRILDQRFPAPFLLAPIGVQSILHKAAELGPA